MAVPQRRSRPATIQELLTPREIVMSRCPHCTRDSADRDHELVEAALRKRIRMLEMRLYELEGGLARTG
jgi:hypothetical protein